MGEKFWQLMLIGMMAFAALFILSIFNIALFEDQCAEYCGGCYSKTNIFMELSACPLAQETSLCLKDCKPHGLRCSFDPQYEKTCSACLEGCKSEQSANESCIKRCFS
jgi:hypothetical protein